MIFFVLLLSAVGQQKLHLFFASVVGVLGYRASFYFVIHSFHFLPQPPSFSSLVW